MQRIGCATWIVGGVIFKSDALIKAFFWFFIIVGVLVIAGIYWLLVVAVSALITLLVLLIQIRTRKKTLENLKPRPDMELNTKFNPGGAVREIKMHPYPVSSGFLGGGQS